MVLTVNDEKDFFVPEEVFDKKTFKRGNVSQFCEFDSILIMYFV